jgi:hypothetical protein
MERLVCGDAALGARDEIMARLYAAALKAGKREAVEARQRKWLRTAEICNASACLAEAYDRRNAELQRSEGGTTVGTDFFSEDPKSPSDNIRQGLSGRDGGDSRRVLKPDLDVPCGPRPLAGSIAVRACATKPT